MSRRGRTKNIQDWIKCPNKGCGSHKVRKFIPTPERPRRFKLYYTQVFDSIRFRYYICLTCGVKFETSEQIIRVIMNNENESQQKLELKFK